MKFANNETVRERILLNITCLPPSDVINMAFSSSKQGDSGWGRGRGGKSILKCKVMFGTHCRAETCQEHKLNHVPECLLST
jgi:hypothetical protein